MSITKGAVVVRLAGDRDMAQEMADALLLQDLEDTRAELKRVTDELELMKLMKAQADNRRLEETKARYARRPGLLNRISRFFATIIIGVQITIGMLTAK